jgi:hypothetical protein
MYFPAMDFQSKFIAVLMLSAITLLFNLPFGYARVKAKRFSFRWFFFIHVPIPFIFIARILSHIEIKYIPFLALAAIIGQLAGGKLEL